MPNYFLVSLSNEMNLMLCIKYALAGFTNSANGFWTYLEIEEGDYVSFLYAAKVWHLYQVKSKVALESAYHLPPWPPVTFRQSGKTYYFPFRLRLEPVRRLEESLVRPEFAYVAENLLLRGGYGKTHFQADQTTLQAVSQMGNVYTECIEVISHKARSFIPRISYMKANAHPPKVYPFSELILQALVKSHLRAYSNLDRFLSNIGQGNLNNQALEVLGERALPEGHVDIIVKDATPIGKSNNIAIEVKRGTATIRDVDQLKRYVEAIGPECKAGVLIALKASPKTLTYARDKGLYVSTFNLDFTPKDATVSFQQLLSSFHLNHYCI